MRNKRKAIKISESLWKMFGAIAKREGRTMIGQLEWFVKDYQQHAQKKDRKNGTPAADIEGA